MFTWLSGCAVVPAALAGPYASELHTGPVAAGLLMAAVPAGAIAGAAAFTLLVRPAARLQPLSWLAAVSSGLLTVVVMRPPLWLVGLAAGGGRRRSRLPGGRRDDRGPRGPGHRLGPGGGPGRVRDRRHSGTSPGRSRPGRAGWSGREP